MSRYLQKLIFLLVLLVFYSTLPAQGLEYSRDGQTLAVNWTIDFETGNDVSQFIFYDAETGKIRSFLNREEIANRLLFSPDSKDLIIGEKLVLEKIGFNEKGELTRLENKNSIENLAFDEKNQNEINSDVLALALSPDGKTLYKLYSNFLNAYSYPELKFLPEKSRSIALKGKDEMQNKFIGISRDGQIVVESEFVNSDSFFVVKENGKATAKIQVKDEDNGWAFPLLSAQISENNEVLMLSIENQMNNRNQIGFWDLKTRKFIEKFPIPMLDEQYKNQFYPLFTMAISPDGKKAATGFYKVEEGTESMGVVALFDIGRQETSYIKVKAEAGLNFAEAMTFSPDSKKLATLSSVISRASLVPRIEIWKVEDGQKIRQFE